MHDQGVKRGDVVSIMMENRIEYLAILVGLNKLGAVSGLLNSNLGGNSLIHCINVTGSSKCIVGEECMTELDAIQDQLSLQAGSDFFFVNDSGSKHPNWAQDLMTNIAETSEDNPTRRLEKPLLVKQLCTFIPPARPACRKQRYCQIVVY